MKNFIILFLSFLSINFAAGQLAGGPTIDHSLPKIVPASPTVAAMMKFEEVPVNNYTGVPDISIPLYSTPTHSKDIALNLSLNYHPAAAAASEVASYVGLGWSFFAGGTISRTVKGLADDTTETGKYGMWNPSNSYDQATGLLGNADSAEEREIINEYMWEASQKGKYDTEYDLYQYNFMGYSGRFYINKNYEVIKLDTSTLRIIYDRFEQTFTIFDDKGYKYFFDIKETTTQSGLTRTIFIDNTIEDTSTPETSFISAFHLSKICNIKPVADPLVPNAQQDDVLVSYTYNTGSPIYEFTKTSTQTDILMTSANPNAVRHLIEGTDCPDIPGALRMIEPISINSGQSLNVLTRKLQSISVKDFVKIEFVTEAGRLDYNLTNPEGANKLKEIIIKEYNTNTIVKKFTLYYDYSNPASKGKRLILTEVKETNYKNSVADAQTFSHKLSYNKSAFAIVNYSSDDIGKDYWGYFNFTPASNRFNKETSSGACTTDLLQKMTLPTGGCILYRFEANTYSYVGSTALTNFDENPDNWTSSDGELSFSNSPLAGPSANATPKMLPFSTNPQYITFIPAPMPGDGSGFQLLESLPVNGVHSINGPYQAVSSLNCSFSGCTLDYTLAGGKYYKVSYGYFTLGETYSAVMHYKNKLRENPTRKWLYGGGVRIKKIGYFEDDAVAASFYEVYSSSNIGITPIKEKNYNYQFFDDVWRSSGALASAKPSFSYALTKKHGIRCAYAVLTVDAYSYSYNTTFNNIQAAGTQGGAVGYQNVTVKETASPQGIEVSNGRQEFTYYSPIDEPDAEEAYSNSYPFVSHANYDYRRGLLRFEKIVNNDNNALVETTYGYERDAKNPVTTGIRFFTPSGSNCPYSNQFVSYIQYKSRVDMCPPGATPPICIYQCGEPLNFISYTYAREAFGWSRLISKTTKEYFYNGTTQNGTLETTQNYTYNTTNHLIETNELITYSGTTPEKVKSKYYYYNSTENINRISEVERIETFKNGALTGSQNIIFSNTIGTSWFSPSYIQSAKGAQPLEDRLQIKKYDAFGNVLEVKQADGQPVSYIYGYNNTKPIAMIEGVGYDSFSSITSYITAAQNASNTDAGDVPTDGTLTPLMTALVNLRTQMAANLSMPHMITTYTYQPLKGVTSVTDSKGSITSYTYDTAGRLITVRDETGKILSENKYNYRP